MQKVSLLLIGVVIFLFACQQKKYGGFTVTGTLKNAVSPKIFLQELPFGGENPIVLDSGTIEKNGQFSLKGIAKEEGLYRIVLEDGPDVLIVNDNDIIEINVATKAITLKVSEEEIAKRKAAWKQPALKATKGILFKYAQYVKDASEGCVTDE